MTEPTFLRDGPVYLDYNATTPVDPAVVDAMLPYLTTHFGNPSTSHAYGIAARTGLDGARAQVAGLIGAGADEIVFTGCGSEANTLAIRGVALAALDQRDHPRDHVVTLTTEHPSVLAAAAALHRRHGLRVTYLPVDEYGTVDLAAAEQAIDETTALVSVQHANSETGTVQPVAAFAGLAHARGALLHVDASQTTGKIPVDVTALGADLLTVTGHKMYAPKGVAALYVRDGVVLEPAVAGGGQEAGRRAGTENVPSIVALGAAANLAADHLSTEPARLAALRDRLHNLLDAALPGRVVLNGHPTERLPHVLNISITGTIGQRLLEATPEVAAATGSACHAGDPEPSPVLLAMGLPRELALAALRLSLGRWTDSQAIDRAAGALCHAAR